jgi:large subunit ribosomal protein L11
MAKEIQTLVKLQAKGGQATPQPPIGPALGAKGVNTKDFCTRFNAATQDRMGKLLPVTVTVYKDKSFDFVIKTVPAPIQLFDAVKLKQGQGSAEPNRKKVGAVTWDQVRAIAQDKMSDLNCFTVQAAMKMVAGTARSMGITVAGDFPQA